MEQVAERVPASLRERLAWTSLAVTAVVYAAYFGAVVSAGPGISDGRAVGLFLGAVIAVVVLQVVAAAVVALRSPAQARDERDLAIDRVASRNAYGVLASAVWCALPLAVVWAGASGPAGGTVRVAVLGEVLMVCFALAEMVRLGTQVVMYRRGA